MRRWPQRYSLVQTTAPTLLPVSMLELREHLSLADDEQHFDTAIRRMAWAAAQTAEAETGRQLTTATWQLTLDAFPDYCRPIELPKPPLVSATMTVDGAAYTSFTVDTGFPGRLIPSTAGWPTPVADYNGIVITFVAGASSVESVPETVRHGILLLVAHWFRNREAAITGAMNEIPLGVQRLFTAASVGDEWRTLEGAAWYDQ